MLTLSAIAPETATPRRRFSSAADLLSEIQSRQPLPRRPHQSVLGRRVLERRASILERSCAFPSLEVPCRRPQPPRRASPLASHGLFLLQSCIFVKPRPAPRAPGLRSKAPLAISLSRQVSGLAAITLSTGKAWVC
ncbi:uncharacterized protein M6B38_327120 [Iris pallida]|uniref:Uncharacterized protein n=1 Tax=Iris pallida TaxID=29817 RepID=A0AAX6H6N1_IRIPA|nr:uncharacterized protein M6B38_327120 [Iris pallida]